MGSRLLGLLYHTESTPQGQIVGMAKELTYTVLWLVGVFVYLAYEVLQSTTLRYSTVVRVQDKLEKKGIRNQE